MDIYLLGLFTAFIIGLIKVCISISALFSMRARNLKKVGIYYSCIGGSYSESEPPTVIKFIFYCIYMVILAPLFSWLSVASSAWGLVAWLTNKTPVPEKVKEIQYKIASIDLSKQQLIQLQDELNAVLGININDHLNSSSIEEDGDEKVLVFDSCNEVSLDPKIKKVFFYSRTDDYQSIYKSNYEYRFEGEKLMIRLLSDFTDHLGKEEWHVKDGVVLKSEIQKRFDESSFKIGSLEEKLSRYEVAIQWYEQRDPSIKFFVMKAHPELFSDNEFRRLVRSELERIRVGIYKVLNFAKENDLEIEEEDAGYSFSWRNKFSEEKSNQMGIFFEEESLKKLEISMNEIYTSKRLVKDLEVLLGERKKAA